MYRHCAGGTLGETRSTRWPLSFLCFTIDRIDGLGRAHVTLVFVGPILRGPPALNAVATASDLPCCDFRLKAVLRTNSTFEGQMSDMRIYYGAPDDATIRARADR